MFEIIKTKLTNLKISNTVSEIWDGLANFAQNFDSSSNNVRLFSLILISVTFSLFIIMTLFIYIKSIVSLIKEDNFNEEKKEAQEEAEKIEAEKKEESETQEREKLAREEQIRQQEKNEQFEKEQVQIKQEKSAQLELRETQEKKEAQKKETLEKENLLKEKTESKAQQVDFDWKKGKQSFFEESISSSIPLDLLQYKQEKKSFDELIGLIIDMLSRGVDNLKIAQTIMFRSQGEVSEEQTMQIIGSVDEFIALCNKGKFRNLVEKGNLPSERDALYNLAKGDNSLCLALIEALMENSIETSNIVGNGDRKDRLFSEVSDLSCTFGSIASINDVHLATGSFELSIELNPQNVVAWSRAADMYNKASSTNKAVWAYHKVIDLADEDLYPEQLANANKILSEYYYDQGNSLQAAKMYNSAKQYYDSIGINRNLDRQELDIIEIIESNQSENLDMAISKLLGRASREAS